MLTCNAIGARARREDRRKGRTVSRIRERTGDRQVGVEYAAKLRGVTGRRRILNEEESESRRETKAGYSSLYRATEGWRHMHPRRRINEPDAAVSPVAEIDVTFEGMSDVEGDRANASSARATGVILHLEGPTTKKGGHGDLGGLRRLCAPLLATGDCKSSRQSYQRPRPGHGNLVRTEQ
jgi:hypothetical protein